MCAAFIAWAAHVRAIVTAWDRLPRTHVALLGELPSDPFPNCRGRRCEAGKIGHQYESADQRDQVRNLGPSHRDPPTAHLRTRAVRGPALAIASGLPVKNAIPRQKNAGGC